MATIRNTIGPEAHDEIVSAVDVPAEVYVEMCEYAESHKPPDEGTVRERHVTEFDGYMIRVDVYRHAANHVGIRTPEKERVVCKGGEL